MKTKFIIILIIVILCAIISHMITPNGLETDLKAKEDSIQQLKRQNEILELHLYQLEDTINNIKKQ